jgi:hypothetical protein
MNPTQKKIQEALVNTMLTDLTHLALTFNQRNPGEGQVGSRWDETQSPASLIAAAETPYGYDAGDNAFGGCEYFQLPIPGSLGILPIDAVIHMGVGPDGAERKVSLEDPKKTTGSSGGGVQAILDVTEIQYALHARKVRFSVVSLGREKEGAPLQVFTVHPGDVSPYVPGLNKPELIGRVVTAQEAKDLGVLIVKLRIRA